MAYDDDRSMQTDYDRDYGDRDYGRGGDRSRMSRSGGDYNQGSMSRNTGGGMGYDDASGMDGHSSMGGRSYDDRRYSDRSYGDDRGMGGRNADMYSGGNRGGGYRDSGMSRGDSGRMGRSGTMDSGMGYDSSLSRYDRGYGSGGYGSGDNRDYGGMSGGRSNDRSRYGSGSGYGSGYGSANFGTGSGEYASGGYDNSGGYDGGMASGSYRSGRRSNQGPHSGRGPEGYSRSTDRITEDVNEELTDHGGLDASKVRVSVDGGEVTLEGTVKSRREKRMAEDVAEGVRGVRDVHNRLRVEDSSGSSPGMSGDGASDAASDADSANASDGASSGKKAQKAAASS